MYIKMKFYTFRLLLLYVYVWYINSIQINKTCIIFLVPLVTEVTYNCYGILCPSRSVVRRHASVVVRRRPSFVNILISLYQIWYVGPVKYIKGNSMTLHHKGR